MWPHQHRPPGWTISTDPTLCPTSFLPDMLKALTVTTSSESCSGGIPQRSHSHQHLQAGLPAGLHLPATLWHNLAADGHEHAPHAVGLLHPLPLSPSSSPTTCSRSCPRSSWSKRKQLLGSSSFSASCHSQRLLWRQRDAAAGEEVACASCFCHHLRRVSPWP